MSVPFFSNQMAFLHVFLRAISFFQIFFNFASVAKAAFCKSRAHRGTPKGGKMSLLFFCNKTAFFMYFYVPFHFFKVFFNFPSVAKAAFCKSRAHRGTPKGGKMSFSFSLIEWHFSCIFTCHFIFLKSFSILSSVAKAAFCKEEAHRSSPKRRKNDSSFLF